MTLWYGRHRRLEAGASLGRRILWLRRFVIVALALLAFAYYRSTPISTSSFGILAFAAVAQFAPGSRRCTGEGSTPAYFGECSLDFWGYLLFLPNLVAGGVLPSHAFTPPEALAWLWPRR